MNHETHVITDEELVKHFSYIGALMVAIAVGIGVVANYIG